MDDDQILERALTLKRAHAPFALATVVSAQVPTSAKAGARAIVHADGRIEGWIGGGCAQPTVAQVARKVLREGRPYLVRISPSGEQASIEGVLEYGMACHSGGSLDIFVEPVLPRPRLLVMGVSATAQALAAAAARAGFAVTAAAPDLEPASFAGAERCLRGFDLDDVVADFVAVATQGKDDEAALEAALSTGAPYVTMVASRRKAAALKQYLRGRGYDPSRVEAIVAPAGLDIGAVTPEEIAVSVLAALIQARRREAAHAVAVLEESVAATHATDPVCGMAVDPARTSYRAEHAGAKYYFCCAGCREAFAAAPAHYLAAAG